MVRFKTLLLAGIAFGFATALHAEEGATGRTLIEAEIDAASGDLAPAADVRLRFDRPEPVYGIGETVALYLEATRDTYVTLVSIGPDGQVVRLFPNKAQPDGLVRAGSRVQVPDPASGARIEVSGPVGREVIKLFASEKPLVIFADLDLKGGGMFRSVSGGIDTLGRSLAEARAAGAPIKADTVVLTTLETPPTPPPPPVVAAAPAETPAEAPPAKPKAPKPPKPVKPAATAKPKPVDRPVATAAVRPPAETKPATGGALAGQFQTFQTDDNPLPTRPAGPRPQTTAVRPAPAAPPQAGLQAQLPQAQMPQLQLPQIQMPQIQMPQMQMPQMQMPQMQMPQVQMPQMQMPQMQMPQMQMPQVQMPQMQMPQIQMPQVQMPQIQLPGGFQIQMPQIQLPIGRSIEPAGEGVEMAAADVAREDCAALLGEFNAAVSARDVAAAATGADRIAVDADCGQYQIPAQRRLAALRLGMAQELMAASAPVGDYATLLVAAEKPQVLWQASATMGQALFAERRFAEAAVAYERAIEIVKNESRTPKAPSEEDIRGLLDRASQARILAANPTPEKPEGEFVPAGRDNRSGLIGGVYSQEVRGVGVTTVPVPITFEFNKTSFTPIGAEAARELLTAIKEQGSETVTLVGHTDRKGSDGYNKVLSQKRAEAVAAFLRDNGVEATIETEGRGASEPIRLADTASLTDDDLDALNRRVEWRRR